MPICQECKKEFVQNPHHRRSEIQKFCSRECERQNYRKSGKSAKNLRKLRRNLKIEVFSHYCDGTPKCACCGEEHIEFLSLDHINNNGAEERRKMSGSGQGWGGEFLYRILRRNNYPNGYQVLCLNCNFAKGHFGVCPHKLEKK